MLPRPPPTGGKLSFKHSVFPTIEVASSTTAMALRGKLHVIRQKLRNKIQLLEQTKERLSTASSPIAALPTTPTVRPLLSPLPGDSNTLLSEARLKNKHYLSAYQLLLSNTTLDSDGSKQLVLGNLSDEFLEAINSPTRMDGVKLFIAAFRTYRQGRITSDNF